MDKFTLVRNGKNDFDKIKLFYENEEIKNAAISKFAFWNSGNVVITHNDIVENKELSIVCGENTKILEAQIIASNEETNKFEIVLLDDRHAVVNFDYIDVKEGAVIQIIYTGEDEFEVYCKIKGGKPLKCIEPQKITTISKVLNKVFPKKFEIIFMGITMILTGLMVLGLLLSLFIEPIRNFMASIGFYIDATSSKDKFISTAILFVFTVIMIYMYLKLVIKVFKIGVPNGLRKYSKFEF